MSVFKQHETVKIMVEPNDNKNVFENSTSSTSIVGSSQQQMHAPKVTINKIQQPQFGATAAAVEDTTSLSAVKAGLNLSLVNNRSMLVPPPIRLASPSSMNTSVFFGRILLLFF